MTPFLYCTDEDIAVKASADYPKLVPRDMALAAGDDGSILPGTWVLRSPSCDFHGVGVLAGGMVLMNRVGAFTPPGELLAIDRVIPGTGLALRRRGLDAGVGQPPPAAAGINFLVSTLRPQIRAASYDLDRRFGVNDLFVGRRSCDLFDPAELREACVLTVLVSVYRDLSRGAYDGQGRGTPDIFGSKAVLYRQELEDLLARVGVHWRPAIGGPGPGVPSDPVTTRFSTRLSR